MTTKENRKTAFVIAGVAAGMVGLSFASVPLYRAFCQATGWGGTTQRAEAGADRILQRTITVRFDASTADGIPWRFRPEQASQSLKIGETGLAFFEAENQSGAAVAGRATFNVSPAKAGIYFKKIQCFCFDEQKLDAGQTASMPVTYFIDPALAENPDLDDVETITLAYTFFPVEESPVGGASGSAAE
jgi:cytochrome c oxidase assembly protein subunit 11